MMAQTIILQPLAMRFPNPEFVYSPSKIRPQKRVSRQEFAEKHGQYPRRIRVCLDWDPKPETIYQRSKMVTVYSFGLDCWYMAFEGPRQ